MKPTPVVRAAIYARKSQDDPRTSDLRSVNWQIDQAKAVAQRERWSVVATLKDEGISGGSTKRPGLIELNRLIDSGAIDLVIVWELSRLWRKIDKLNELLSKCDALGVRVYEFSSGRFRSLKESTEWLGTMTQAAVDEFMRRQTSDRVRAKLKSKAEKGLPPTAAGFGYVNVRNADGEGDWRVEPDQAKVVTQIFKLYAAGHSVRVIVHHLNEIKALTPRLGARGRGVWTPTAVNKILRRPIYRGELNSGFQRDDLRIVDDAIWHRVQTTLDAARGRAPAPPTRRSSRWLLSSILRCPDCGASMVAYGGFAYACYSSVANGPNVCANRLRLPLKKVDAAVLDQLVPYLAGPVIEKAVKRAIDRTRANAGTDPAKRISALEREIENIRQGLIAGVFTTDDARSRIVARQSEIDTLRAQAVAPTNATAVLSALRAAAQQLPALMTAHPIEARRVVRALVADARIAGQTIELDINIPSTSTPRC